MGIFQDNFSGLSEVERLAAMAHDPVRIHEIGADQWPLAMMACAIMAGNDEDKQEENARIYEVFAAKTPVAARRAGLQQLTRFIASRRGEGWKNLAPYALQEPEPALALKAALSMLTLAQPGAEQPLAGVQELVRLCIASGNPVLLNALLSLGDMRVLPLLEPLTRRSAAALSPLLAAVVVPPNRLSLTWVLQVLAAHPDLAPEIAELLCALAPKAPVILDVVVPIPTWAFEKAAPQALHGWTPAEYFDRMFPELEPRLSPEALARVRAAYGSVRH